LGTAGVFDWHLFGAALTVGIALITQMGEQADYLRFMPQQTPKNRVRWWAGVLVGGPGWVLLGVAKMLGGACLAYLAISHSVPTDRAVDPNQMYLAAYEYLFPVFGWAVAATALFVVVSQIKINVTNAYAGSLAWSNFFSRLTHSHPGRVVWVVFNCLIALMLMEMNVFQALGEVLGLYSNIAIAWMMAVVADLVINKPLGLSPKGIEFKRAHLYDINPVGVGAMVLASGLSIAAYLGLLGETAKAFSAMVALVTALVTAPLIAWLTRGKYYIARSSPGFTSGGAGSLATHRCVICERNYEGPDMAYCPAYQGAICSLCCTLDARCGDACKPHASVSSQWSASLRWLLPKPVWPYLETGLGHFLLLMATIVPVLVAVFGIFYRHELAALVEAGPSEAALQAALLSGFSKAFAALLLLAGIVAWWLVLAHKSRQVAQQESNRQTHLLVREIALHRQTDKALQDAKQLAEQAHQQAEEARQQAEQARLQAEHANQAKSRYISAISHELRTPLNSILGYAQLMGEDPAIPPHRKQAVGVIKRGGEHLLSLIEGTLDMAQIESGKLTLNPKPMAFARAMEDTAAMFELQAREKGLSFGYEVHGSVPQWVRADDKRLRQIVFNLVGNAIKFTQRGAVRLCLRHAREMAHIEVHDTGPGMSAVELERVFEPFARGQAVAQAGVVGAPGSASVGGSGLGLTIAKMLTDLMGGELTASSEPGVGSVFRVRLFVPEIHRAPEDAAMPGAAPSLARRGYVGARRTILVVDNEEADRGVLVNLLQPLGFAIRVAASGHDALDLVAGSLRPHVVLLDLAMPGIDGWETLRRMRAMGPHAPHVAMVSANAFERGVDNALGIATEDFFVKPVRHSELLDWLERKLGLVWVYGGAVEPERVSGTGPLPPRHALLELQSLVQLGYPRGIANQLAQIERQYPACAGFTAALLQLCHSYQLDAVAARVQQALDHAAV
jgi:signal transduction histidine kinase/CheY-like chemotaxis protein